MSKVIHLSEEQYAILRDLVNRGMEEKLSPFDDLEPNPEELDMINETLAAAAFFNSHNF